MNVCNYRTIVLPNTDEGHGIAGTLLIDNIPITVLFFHEGMVMVEDFLYWESNFKMVKTLTKDSAGVMVVGVKLTSNLAA